MTWWKRLVKRDRLERELDAELRFHLDQLAADNVRTGMPVDEAWRRARLAFGGMEQVKEECRDARATRWAHDLVLDVRFAARLLTKDRAFTALAVMALALGIGVASMFFTIVNALCLRGPLTDPAGLVHVGTRDTAGAAGGMSYADFIDLQHAIAVNDRLEARGQALAGLAAYGAAPLALGDDRLAPERVTGAYVSQPALRLLGEAPVLGRDFTADDDRAGAPPVAILASALWQRRYAADPAIVGRTIRINGTPTAVIGVMRDAFRFPADAELWLPLSSMPALTAQPRNARTLGAFGRLAEGGTIPRAQAALDRVALALNREHPRTNGGVRLTLDPLNEQFTSRIADPAWMAFITAGVLVLLVACANVANLLLGRAVRRSAEMAIRASLGAGRARIVRQLLAECTLLAAAGGTTGILLSLAGTRAMSAAIPDGALPSWMNLTMDGWVLAALTGVCLATVFLFGFVPALHTSKTSVPHVLRHQARTQAAATGARRWTTAFLAVQFALTFVLVSAVVQSLRSPATTDEDVTLDATNMLTAWVSLPAPKYAEPVRRMQFYEQLLQEAGGGPGVASASLASALPYGRPAPSRLVLSGVEAGRTGSASTVGAVAIADRYFDTLGVGLLQGRAFTAEDGTAGHEAAIVNERAARLYFRDEGPIGTRVRLEAPNGSAVPGPWLTIVGVSPNIAQHADAIVYTPFRGAPPATAALIVRGRADSVTAAALRDRVRRLDPDLPLYRTMSLERVISDAGWNPRVSSAIIHSISTIALILAVVGLYGVTVHAVAARVREIGIRVALGARPRHVRWLVLRRALFQLSIGAAAGAVLTIVWNRLFIVSSTAEAASHVAILAIAAILIVGLGAIACLLPAHHAARLDPLAALRTE